MCVKQVEEYLDAFKAWRSEWDALGGKITLKVHHAAHLGARAPLLGAPSLYGTWPDETWNKVLKGSGVNAHRRVWYRRVLGDMRRLSQKVMRLLL